MDPAVKPGDDMESGEIPACAGITRTLSKGLLRRYAPRNDRHPRRDCFGAMRLAMTDTLEGIASALCASQ